MTTNFEIMQEMGWSTHNPSALVTRERMIEALNKARQHATLNTEKHCENCTDAKEARQFTQKETDNIKC